MKTQDQTDRIKLKAKVRYRDALVRFHTKHLDFRLLAAEALDGNNRADAEAIQPEPGAQFKAQDEAFEAQEEPEIPAPPSAANATDGAPRY